MTDRTLRRSADLDALDFEKGDGLLPVVAQDAEAGDVLMLAYADREALEATLATGEAHFRSRSRGGLWRKGETSGHTLQVVSLHADCDADTVLARVRPAGPACHTGEQTCFGGGAAPVSAGVGVGALDHLWRVVDARARERPEGSYTVRLLDDPNLRLKKLGEELAELVAALATGDADATTEEAADLLYHLLVALRGAEVDLASVTDALAARAR